MGQHDAEVLAGQTFYRSVATPAAPGQYGYVGIMNPSGSGIRTFIDDIAVWPGLPTQAAEVGIMHYATRFSTIPGFNFTGTIPLMCTNYSFPNSVTEIDLGTYNALLNTWIDYVFVGPRNVDPMRQEHIPYSLLIGPGDGIVIWNPTQGFELKVNLWIRELPVNG